MSPINKQLIPAPEDNWAVFRALPAPALIIRPDAPHFTIVEINDALLALVGKERGIIIGRSIFEAFPDNSPEKDGEKNLSASIEYVITDKQTHFLDRQRYDIPDPETGKFEEKHWSARNTPVLNENGDVIFIIHTTEDITEKVIMENALQNNLQHYLTLFDHNPDAVFSLNTKGYFTGVNQAAVQLLKYEAEKVLSLHFTDVCLPEEAARIQKSFVQCLSGEPVGIQLTLVTAEARRVELSVNAMPVILNGDVVGVYGIAKDETENIRRSKEKDIILKIGQIFSNEDPLGDCMQAILETLCLFTGAQAAEAWISNIDRKELIFSAYCNTNGHEPPGGRDEEGINKLVKTAATQKKVSRINDLQSDPEFSTLDFVLQNNFRCGIAVPVIFKDHVIAVITFYTVSSRPGEGIELFSEVFLSHFASHIQRKKAEDELNQYFNLSPDLLCIAGYDHYFKKVNPAFTKIIGYTNRELLSKPYYEFVHPEDRHIVDHEFLSLKLGDSGQPFENRCIARSGEVIWLSWTTTSLKTDRLVYAVARDITGQKKLEKLIANEQQKFARMFTEAPVSMCIMKGKDHVFESANELYYKFTGSKNIIGKPVREVFPEIEDQIGGWLDNVYETGETFTTYEESIKIDVNDTGHPEQFYLSFMYQAYRNDESEIEGVFCFCVDVTEQVLARKKIEESEKQYADLIQNLPAAVYTTDLEGRVKLYNKATAALWGFSPEIGTQILDEHLTLYNTDFEPIPMGESPLLVTLNTGVPVRNYEVILKRPDGSLRNVMPYPSPVFNSDHEIIGGINILVDITEIKKADEELRKLSLIAKRTDNAVLITDPEGKIEWVNEAFTRITEFSFEEVLGKYSTILHGPETSKAVLSYIKEKNRLNQPFECEILKYTKSGKPIWMEIKHQALFDSKGNLTHYFNIEANITERKQAYEEVLKSESEIRRFARQQNMIMEAERARIAREIHDEFGQQLTGLKMSLSSLKKQITSNPSNAGKLLATVLSDVDQSIQSLREFATELRPGILDTLGLFPSIGWLAKDFEKKTGIPCSYALKVKENQFVNESLSICFFRICQEALTNVAKHAGASHVYLEMEQQKDILSLKITDNGKGIVIDKLNDPFSTGLLGMRERASLVGGDLTINSYPGSKTIVHFLVNINNA